MSFGHLRQRKTLLKRSSNRQHHTYIYLQLKRWLIQLVIIGRKQAMPFNYLLHALHMKRKSNSISLHFNENLHILCLYCVINSVILYCDCMYIVV